MSETKIKSARLDPTGSYTEASLALGDGSVGSPSLSFTNATSSGLYKSGTNAISLATNGSNALSIDSSQNSIFGGTVTINSAANPALLVQGSANGSTPRFYTKNTNSTSGQSRTSVVGALGSDGSGVSMQGGYDSSNNSIQMINGDIYLQLGVGGTEYARITTNGLQFQSTTGIVGQTNGGNATAGNVGEYVSSYVSAGTSFPTSGQYGDLTSISLTAGDWDVSLVATVSLGSATAFTSGVIALSTLSGNSNNGLGANNAIYFIPPSSTVVVAGVAIPSVRVSIATTTTYYFKYYGVYSTAAPAISGIISARRVR